MENRSNNLLVGTITLLLLLAVAGFTVWLARAADGATKEYDIFFKQSVAGLARGSGVQFSGVSAGQVKKIELWKADPEFVRVRIEIDENVPILVGTSATIQGVGFTGVSEIQLEGSKKNAPKITEIGPAGVPVIPTKPGALGQLLNNAPQLVERLSILTERLNELLGDRNQKSIEGILANLEKVSGDLSQTTPEMRATLVDARLAIARTGKAAEEIGALASSTSGLINSDGKPLIADLKRSIASADKSMKALEEVLAEAKPGMTAFSQRTLPEIGALVRDLRSMSASLSSVAEKLDQRGAGSLISSPALPDYEPR